MGCKSDDVALPPTEKHMIRFAPVVLVFLFPFALSADDKKDTPFKSKEGKFSVALPGKPAEQTTKVPSDLGQLEVHLFVVDLKDKAYLVSYSDYPKGSVGDKSEKIEKVLDGVVNGNAKGVKGKLLSQEKITIGKKKYAGREVQIEMPDKKGLYRARVFLVGDRLYQAIALGPTEFAKGKDVDAFLDSLVIEE
jgi:hypothetical protein